MPVPGLTDISERKRTLVGRFLVGMRSPWDGFVYMVRHPGLWKFAILPILVNLAVTLLIFVGLVATIGAIWAGAATYFPDGVWWRLGEILAALVLVVLALGAALMCYLVLGGILCGYFNTMLARRVELQLGTPAEYLKEVGLWYQVVDTTRDLAVLLGINVGCLVLNVVPGVGAAVSLLSDWYVFGVDYLDYPMSLRGMRRGEKRVVTWKRNRPETLGLGAVVFGFNFIPVVGSVVLTTAAVGAVLLYQRLVVEGRE